MERIVQENYEIPQSIDAVKNVKAYSRKKLLSFLSCCIIAGSFSDTSSVIRQYVSEIFSYSSDIEAKNFSAPIAQKKYPVYQKEEENTCNTETIEKPIVRDKQIVAKPGDTLSKYVEKNDLYAKSTQFFTIDTNGEKQKSSMNELIHEGDTILIIKNEAYTEISIVKEPPKKISPEKILLAISKKKFTALEEKDPTFFSHMEEYVRKISPNDGFSPDIILSLLLKESGGDINATSNKNAKGLFQHLLISDIAHKKAESFYSKDHSSLDKEGILTVAYLEELRERFGTIEKALVAYNVGPTRLSRVLRGRGIDDDNLLVDRSFKYYSDVILTLAEMKKFKDAIPKPEKK